MSGFVSVFRRDGSSVSTDVLDEMLDRIAHRGPDGTGGWANGSVGLGHQRLCTTPESKRLRPPVENDDGTVILTGDYRLDNRTELFDQLEITDENISDGELLVAAYEHWGRRCPEELVGSFAFVIWDDPRSRLFCARDHLGVKPFYLHESDDLVVVGSEASAVLAHPAVSVAVDELRVGEYLADRWGDRRRTFYQDVRRHPPAHTLCVGVEDVRERQYWQLDPERELDLGSDDAYAEEFRRRFDEAIRCRLRGADEPAVTLSGGLDSSAVAGIVHEQHDGTVHTVSNCFEDGSDADEREFLDAMLDTGAFDAHIINGDAVDPLDRLQRRVEIQDGPIHPGMFWHSLANAERMANEGYRVTLSGWGGDQVVSHGYERLRELARRGRVVTLASEMRALRTRKGYPLRSQLWDEVAIPFAPAPFRWLWRTVAGADIVETANPALTTAFVERLSLRDQLRTLRDESPPARTARAAHCTSVVEPIHVQMLELTDRLWARHGLEPRYPFTDRRLVEFCVALPAAQKLRDGYGRYVLRNALADVLPESIRTRTTKAGFERPFADALAARLHDGHPTIDEFEHASRYLDVDELHRMRQRVVDDNAWHTANQLAKAYALEHWLDGVHANQMEGDDA